MIIDVPINITNALVSSQGLDREASCKERGVLRCVEILLNKSTELRPSRYAETV